MLHVQMDPAFEEDDDEGETSEDRTNFAEVAGLDDVEDRSEDNPGQHENQDVRHLGALKEIGQEVSKEDKEADTQNRNCH